MCKSCLAWSIITPGGHKHHSHPSIRNAAASLPSKGYRGPRCFLHYGWVGKNNHNILIKTLDPFGWNCSLRLIRSREHRDSMKHERTYKGWKKTDKATEGNETGERWARVGENITSFQGIKQTLYMIHSPRGKRICPTLRSQMGRFDDGLMRLGHSDISLTQSIHAEFTPQSICDALCKV